jgi:hypothetical protein
MCFSKSAGRPLQITGIGTSIPNQANHGYYFPTLPAIAAVGLLLLKQHWLKGQRYDLFKGFKN